MHELDFLFRLGFCLFKLLYFNFWFLLKSDLRIFCLQEALEKLSELNTFRVNKTMLSSTFLIKLRFQG